MAGFEMTSINVPITEEMLTELKRLATERNVAPEELAQAALSEMLKRADDKFEEGLEYVLEKNKELYRRLA
jgi:predicted transcriptional regulator